ncbi:hypothetical protein CHH28_12165 [Bacterioplanes sanyensis]|uniref:Lipid/polyisoprenoid-binding YceI-like domain-containing protein n=1 Tax=Bacterioplanes sanyensis TaxID=1249553 RepID=A0A222FKU5_9GAMM|nr:YceI family protein [Bacterioplanes sanyensis]ASP39379.1 hypothetical protein CHH28_12165 [Bacterioplanes sanyensis]
MKLPIASALLSALLPLSALAQWQLTEPTEVSFVSYKNVHLAEHHRFDRILGSVSSEGNAEVRIDLSSIDSRIPIRDERMRDLLFNVKEFGQAVIRAQLPESVLTAKQPQRFELEGHLALHGSQENFRVAVLVTPASNGQVVVSSLYPVMVHADSFALSKGLRELTDIAKLDVIAEVVPVHFTLTFEPAN